MIAPRPPNRIKIDPKSSIPRAIHQIWLQGQQNIPAEFLSGVEAWRRHHADWQYTLWDESSIRRMLRESYAWFLPVYSGYRYLHQRADAARYFILYRFGGVYADIDTEPVRALDSLFHERDGAHLIVPALKQNDFERKLMCFMFGARHILTNCVLAASKNNEVLRGLLLALPASRRLMLPFREPHISFSTGPLFLTTALKREIRKNRSIDVLPQHYFDVGPEQAETTDGYVVHYAAATWHSSAFSLLLRYYARVVEMLWPNRNRSKHSYTVQMPIDASKEK